MHSHPLISVAQSLCPRSARLTDAMVNVAGGLVGTNSLSGTSHVLRSKRPALGAVLSVAWVRRWYALTVSALFLLFICTSAAGRVKRRHFVCASRFPQRWEHDQRYIAAVRFAYLWLCGRPTLCRCVPYQGSRPSIVLRLNAVDSVPSVVVVFCLHDRVFLRRSVETWRLML